MLMSFRPYATSTTAIYSTHMVTSGSAKYALNYLATRSSSPQGHLLMAVMTSYRVEASLGAISTAYHLCCPVSIWNLETFGPWRQSASKAKFPAPW